MGNPHKPRKLRNSEIWTRVKKRLDYANDMAELFGEEKYMRSEMDCKIEIQLFLALREYRRNHGEPDLRFTVKELLLLDDWHDLTAQQIADVLGVDIASVADAIRRIKKDFKYDLPRVRYSKSGGHTERESKQAQQAVLDMHPELERNDHHD